MRKKSTLLYRIVQGLIAAGTDWNQITYINFDKETTPKYYFSDNGLLNLFLDKAEARLLENPVAVNLWSRYKGAYSGREHCQKSKKIFYHHV